jgi:ADP-dependent NAD(P)H-hydrate dehydratase / NAD(P)H-hydrate epimerase
MYLCTTAQIRKADQRMIQQHGFPGILLMETAGRKSAEWILAHYPDAACYLILAGPGNNGGDGLVIARYLRLAGKPVEILLSHDPAGYKGDALLNWNALAGSGIPVRKWPCDLPAPLHMQPGNCLLIDALLGTGVTEEIRGPIAEIIESLLNDKGSMGREAKSTSGQLAPTQTPVIAIDLPSGLSADTGMRISTPLKATATLTFACPKVCHYLTPAANDCGEIVTIDIGIWPAVMDGLGIRRYLLDHEVAAGIYRQRPRAGHKGTFGHALVAGGSQAYVGAIALTGMAVLQSGAGLSTVFTTESARCAVYTGHAELMVKAWGDASTPWLSGDALPMLREALAGKDAVAVGPGLANELSTFHFLQGLLQAWNQPLVLDADALNILASEPELWRHVPRGSILTPHPGEMARLLPGFDVLNKRLEAAEHLAQQKQVIVVLKGAGTVVALPDGKTYVNTTGNAGMATGGAGDVLTGILAGLMAQGYDPREAALLGVYLHGLAGDFCRDGKGAGEAVTASGIAAELGLAFQTLT